MQPAVIGAAHGTDVASTESVERNRILFVMIAALALAGVIVSAVSLQRHYAKSATSFCEVAEKFSCDIVNRSEYSTIMGIPVAGIGMAGYGALFAMATFVRARKDTVNKLLAAAVGGLAFALYLTYIEARVLDTWCILCLISLATISAISLMAVTLKLRGAKS